MMLAATGLASREAAEKYLDPQQATQLGGVANLLNFETRLRYISGSRASTRKCQTRSCWCSF